MAWYRGYVNMLLEWPIGTLLAIVFTVTAALFALLVLSGLFVATDSWFLPGKKGTGEILEKEFVPARTELVLMYNPATKTSLPQPIYHPNDWSLLVGLDGKSAWISVSERYYAKIKVGDRVRVTYVNGRISDGLYLRSVK